MIFAQDVKTKVEQTSIDDEIAHLQQKKAVYLQRERYAQREAHRLIFIDYFNSAQLAYQAENYHKAVQNIDQQIEALQSKKIHK